MLLWKGINFRDKGIIVEKTPKISKAKKKIQIYQVDGRNGFLSIDTNSYEEFPLTVECHIADNVNKDDVTEFLDGYGTLSLDGIRQYTAIINNAIEFEKVLKFKRFPVQFLVNPIAEDILPTNVIITESDYNLFIDNAYTDIFPVIRITGVGEITITINNETFYLINANDTYTLDCKNKIIVDSFGNNASSNMLYNFPKLKKGNNIISYAGEVTNFEIDYKKTYL